jgi:hypothetical protein
MSGRSLKIQWLLLDKTWMVDVRQNLTRAWAGWEHRQDLIISLLNHHSRNLMEVRRPLSWAYRTSSARLCNLSFWATRHR